MEQDGVRVTVFSKSGYYKKKTRIRKQNPSDTLRSPEMFAPARMPVADGKKMENMPKKVPSGPRQPGTKLAAKMSAVEEEGIS